MLLVGKPAGAPDTGNKPGGQTVGHGAADLKATYRAIRGSNDLPGMTFRSDFGRGATVIKCCADITLPLRSYGRC